MLFLQFQLGKDRYVLNSAEVTEVLPLLEIKRIPRAPKGVMGAFNYRGVPVPVVDLNMLATGNAGRLRMSTRILIVRFLDKNRVPRPLGFIAEKVTDTINRDPKDFADSGVSHEETRYLGPVLADEAGLIQWVKVMEILPQDVLNVLFKGADKVLKEELPATEVTS